MPPEARHCPACGSKDLKPLGKGRTSVVYEYVPAFFERQVHVQEVLACTCGQGVVTAPAPARVVDRGEYGPGFLAHVVTSKCADAMPLHRLAQRVERGGVPMSRSTLTDLFHQSAQVLLPLSSHLLQVIAAAEVVWADETPVRVLDVKKTKQGYLWTFLTQTQQGEWLIGYRFSLGRASTTPRDVLGGTRGALVVDAYTGYNAVTLPAGRVRVGCWAHVRRRFFEALPTAPEARVALDFILALYRVEAQARDAGLVRTEAHRELRQQKSTPVLAALRAWLEEQTPLHPPKGPLGQALSYARKQWDALTRFVSDARLPLDNNRSEAALRKAALGRKNFLFVGHEAAGENLAGLYALVATCEANGVNPVNGRGHGPQEGRPSGSGWRVRQAGAVRVRSDGEVGSAKRIAFGDYRASWEEDFRRRVGGGFRKLSPSMTRTWEWWRSRSMAALAINGSPKRGGHSSMARLEVMTVLLRS
ncbi:hypothetical protein COSO111634_30920 [Corallococcus soli]